MTVNENSNLSVSRFFSRGEKSDQKVTKFWGYKKQDFVKSLEINNLQSLVVPRAVVKVSVAIVSRFK